MKKNGDFIFIPVIKANDILNTGNNITGKMIMTKKYFAILPDVVQDSNGTAKRDLYDKTYFEDFLNNYENIDLVNFETELISKIPERYVMSFLNLEKFEVNVGFLFFGGIRYKLKGEKIQSAFVGNKTNRLMIKDFYEKVVKY
ncbi:MAG: hypothetical protein PHW83_04630 [Bacteroidales bacterium]|nr:hypothetical protein [Bacteroidales bacterium]